MLPAGALRLLSVRLRVAWIKALVYMDSLISMLVLQRWEPHSTSKSGLVTVISSRSVC